ncbi:hypothetical protein HK104_010911 [Borealophlyctis nickersoniae]|nr:hypothetical protein HK104_010911 [Borealophlyctis nickersoniae]
MSSEQTPLLSQASSSRPVRALAQPKSTTKGVLPMWSPNKKYLKRSTPPRPRGQTYDYGFTSDPEDETESTDENEEDDEDNDHPIDARHSKTRKRDKVRAWVKGVGPKFREPTWRERWAFYLDNTTFGRW